MASLFPCYEVYAPQNYAMGLDLVTSLQRNIIEAEILTRCGVGDRVFNTPDSTDSEKLPVPFQTCTIPGEFVLCNDN